MKRRNSYIGYVTGLIPVLLFFLGGCITTKEEFNLMQTRQREDLLTIKDDVRRAEGRFEGTDVELRTIRAELDSLRNALAGYKATNQELAAEVQSLKIKIDAVDAARQKDAQEMVSQVSSRLTEIVKQTAVQQPVSGVGYEHVVRPGETLSEIAAAYGVKASAIIEANKLQNPDRLSVNQKLFVPK